MEASQLKQELLDKLISVEDENLLQQVNQLIGEVDLEKRTFNLSKKQLEMMLNSEADIAKENVITNEDLNEDEEKWLNG
jgi:hypothetical protein